jgi:hypothetical protein
VDAVAVAPEEALAARAAETPEAPFLFFRGPRGSFVWWSWARARAESAAVGGGESDEGGAPGAREYLAGLLGLGPADAAPGAALLAALPPLPERPIWLTCGGLERPVERATAAAALAGGWAVVLEPGPAIHAATFAWARPTVLAGSTAELAELFSGFEALAPRWRRRAWLTRRTARLRALVVGAGEDGETLGARARALGAPAAVLSIPRSGW